MSLFIGFVVPFLGHLLLPVLIFLDLINTVLDDLEGKFDLLVLHVLIVVELVGEFEKLINFLLLRFLLLLFSGGPCWLAILPRFFALLTWFLRGHVISMAELLVTVVLGGSERLFSLLNTFVTKLIISVFQLLDFLALLPGLLLELTELLVIHFCEHGLFIALKLLVQF